MSTESTNAPSEAPEPGTPPEPATRPEPRPASDADDVAALRREAAGYRRSLRAVEAERDHLREHIDRRDRADAERIAGQSLESGADLWVGGVELAALRDDDGALSPDLVAQAVERVLVERPHWRATVPSFDGGARRTLESAPSFGEALKATRRPA